MSPIRRTAIARNAAKRALLRASLFPELDEADVWDVKNRKKTKGWTSMPRTMPLMGAIMDMLSGKGKPVSTVYLELWCRADEKGFLTLSKPAETAFASGYSGERGVSTWKERIRRLEALEFITTKSGPSGDLNYVQIWNPYLVIKRHAEKKTVGLSEQHYNALLERSFDVGANDLAEVEEPPVVPVKIIPPVMPKLPAIPKKE